MCALDPGDNTVPLCSQAMQYSGYIETLGDKSEEEEKSGDWSQAGQEALIVVKSENRHMVTDIGP